MLIENADFIRLVIPAAILTRICLGHFCIFIGSENGVLSRSLGSRSRRHRNTHKTCDLSLISVRVVDSTQ